MRVTIIICNYNYEKYLGYAIESAVNQTHKCNIVVVDDASTDQSWQKIEYYCQKYENVHGIRLEQNCGPSYARNVAIEHTLDLTDVYAILDADDEMYPNKVQRCLEVLNQSPMIGVVYADYDIYNEATGNTIRQYGRPYDKLHLNQECIVHSGSVIKKEVLLSAKDQFGFYDVTMRTCEDYDLWMRISDQFVIFHLPEALTLVKIQPRNSSVSVDKSIWERNWQRVQLKARGLHDHSSNQTT